MCEFMLNDRECLRPRLLADPGGGGPRVEGVLVTPPALAGESAPRLVERVEFDGSRCRYRLVGDAHGPGPCVDGHDAAE